jgi:hypothetical protein
MAYMSATSQSGSFLFIINITAVNGTSDADQTNDTMRSQFIVAPNWPDTIAVKMLTSNLAADGQNLNANPADASWCITNANGDTIISRNNTNYSTLYVDTVILPHNGFYKFTVSTPGFCAGLHWWLFDQALTGYAPGYLQVKKMTGANIPMHGFTYAANTTPAGLKNFGEHDDFGCGYSQYFYVSSLNTTGVQNVKKASSVAIYPNPAGHEINVDFDNTDIRNSTLTVVNVLGQTVYTTTVNADHVSINSSKFIPGVYNILFHNTSGSSNIGKVVVAH